MHNPGKSTDTIGCLFLPGLFVPALPGGLFCAATA